MKKYIILIITIIMILFSYNVYASLNTGLVTYYNFDQASTIIDQANGNSNSVANTFACQVTGKINKACLNNVQGGAYSINFTLGDMPTGTAPRTINFWLRNDNATYLSNGKYFSMGDKSSFHALGFWTTGSAGYINVWNNDPVFPMTKDANNWHMWTFIFDGFNTIQVYRDSVFNFSNTSSFLTTSFINNTYFHIGYDGYIDPTGANAFTIDEMGIWNRALTTTEISDLYNNSAGQTFPLIDLTNSTGTVNLSIGLAHAYDYSSISYGHVDLLNYPSDNVVLDCITNNNNYELLDNVYTTKNTYGFFNNTLSAGYINNGSSVNAFNVPFNNYTTNDNAPFTISQWRKLDTAITAGKHDYWYKYIPYKYVAYNFAITQTNGYTQPTLLFQKLLIGTGADCVINYPVGNTIQPNTWAMYTTVYNGTTLALYINDTLVASAGGCHLNASGSAYDNTPYWLWTHGDDPSIIPGSNDWNYNVNSTIGHLAFWNKALNSNEVANLFNYSNGIDMCTYNGQTPTVYVYNTCFNRGDTFTDLCNQGYYDTNSQFQCVSYTTCLYSPCIGNSGQAYCNNQVRYPSCFQDYIPNVNASKCASDDPSGRQLFTCKYNSTGDLYSQTSTDCGIGNHCQQNTTNGFTTFDYCTSDFPIQNNSNQTSYFNNNTINMSLGNITYQNAIFSTQQCIKSGSTNYICNNTIYNNNTNSFLCSPDNLQLCPNQDICLTYELDINNSYFTYFDMTHTCNSINQNVVTGVNLLCGGFWSSPTLKNLISIITGQVCDNFTTSIVVPTPFCNNTFITQFSVFQYFPNDIWASQGQCFNVANQIQDTCTNFNQTTCYNTTIRQQCQINNFTGHYQQNPIDMCNTGFTCTNGVCINQSITNPPTTPFKGNQTIAGIDFSTQSPNTKMLIIIVTILLTIGILMGIGIYSSSITGSAGMISVMSFLSGLCVVAEFIFFAFIGFIPVWIIVLIIVVGAAIGSGILLYLYKGSGANQ